MVKRSAWQKNNWRELRKTMGRFLAIVSIVALGVGFFTGLKAARPTMVATCNEYLDQMQFFDYQLISSIAFDKNAEEDFRRMDGVAAAEGAVSADLLTVLNDQTTVFKTHQLTETVNRIKLTAGRMPEAPNECLADDLIFGPEALGLELTVQHQEDSIFSQDSYVIVGLCNSPQYLNMARGTTSLGNGTVTGFLFLTEDGYDTDYHSEIYLRLAFDRDAFSENYTDTLETWEDPLMDQMEVQGKNRLDHILEEAREELADGWEEYRKGKAEYEDAKVEAEAELAEAEAQLRDAERQLADGRTQLADGENTLWKLKNDPYSIPELADARKQLDDGWAELLDGEQQYQDGLAQYNSMAGSMELLLTQARRALSTAQAALDAAQANHDKAEAAYRETKAALELQQKELYAPVAQQQARAQQAQGLLETRQQELAKLEQEPDPDPTALMVARFNVETARADALTQQAAYEAAQAAYDLQAASLEAQLGAAELAFQAAQNELDKNKATVETLRSTINDYEQQLENAEQQLLDAKVQINEGRAKLEDGEAQLEQELQNAIATAESELAKGRAELADGEQKYADGLKEYEDGKAEADEEFAKAEKELAKGLRELQQAELDLSRMEDPSYYALTPASNNGYISFDNDTSIVEGIAKVFPLFFFLVAALVCSSTMTRMVEEQRTQNGTLKAMGYSDGTIMMRYAAYAGGGALIGFVLGQFIGTFLFPFVIWEAYQMLYHFSELTYLFHWNAAIVSLLASLVCSVGAACLAARSDLKQMPAQLMRPKTPKAGKRIFLEYITPLWNSLSFLAKVSLRNIFRYKKRLFMMVLGTGGCLALLLAGLGLRDSISNVVDDQFGNITMYDYAVSFSEHQDQADRSDFLEAVGPHLEDCIFVSNSMLDVPTSRGTKSVSFVACSDPAIDKLLGLFWEEQDLGYPTGDGFYISHALAEDAGVSVGDSLKIQLESKDMIEIPITGIFTNYVSHYAFLTEEGYETWFGIAPEIKSALATSAAEDPYLGSAAIQSYEGVANVIVSKDMETTVADAMSSLNAIIVLVVGFASALAFVVGYNLININITERVREIATIKVLGFYQKETHAYVFRESILLTILGAIAGVPLGIWLHSFIMNSVKVDFVCFQVQISPLSFALGIALTLLVTIVVDKLLGKKIDRINMAESLKSVE